MTSNQWLVIGVLALAVVVLFTCGAWMVLATITASNNAPMPAAEIPTTRASNPTAMASATSRPNPTNTPDIKQSARTDLPYDSLARNTESYVGQLVYYRGRVEQVAEVSGLKAVLRVSVTQSDYGLWKDVIWVNYEGPRVLENDIVRLSGKVRGRHEYTAIFGQSIVIPEIDAVSLQVEPKMSHLLPIPAQPLRFLLRQKWDSELKQLGWH